LLEGDHIRVTASKYPFPTVCADKQSTDWFHAISRTLKWNERERQKSFVVVEESSAKEEQKFRQRKNHPELTASASKGDEEEDEVSDEDGSDEEEEKFDIDDLSSENSDAAPTAGDKRDSSFGSSPGASPSSVVAIGAAEAIMGVRPRAHTKARAKSRSRSGVRSGVDSPDRFAPVPPRQGPGHGHVQWAASVSSSADNRSSQPEGGMSDSRTPTTTAPTRRTRSRSPAAPIVHPHQHPRAFAVWGQDESDSNSSDNDP
jgi:NAD+ kinase